jgi:hypothetical protein
MPASALYGPICYREKRSNCSLVSHTSVTRIPSLVLVTQWKMPPSAPGVIRETFRNAAGRGHHEYVHVAIILAGERDLRSVGRKHRFGLYADARGEASRVAAFAAHAPEVGGKAEDDLRAADGGMPQQ